MQNKTKNVLEMCFCSTKGEQAKRERQKEDAKKTGEKKKPQIVIVLSQTVSLVYKILTFTI